MKSPLYAAGLLVAVVVATPTFAESTNQEAPADVQQQFEQALSLRAGGDLYAAIETLNGVLAAQPTLHRARLELAVTYYRAAEFHKSITLANEVLADPAVSPEVKQTVQIFLDQVNAIQKAESERRHTFSGGFGIGGGHDDNVNAGPSSDLFDIDGSELVLSDDSKPKSDVFASVRGNINHSYRLPGSVDLGASPVMAFWQSTASVYRREYDDEHRYTVDVISGSTGLALISRENWRAKMNVQVDQIRLGDDALALYSSLNPSWTYSDNNGSEYTLRGQWLNRDFKNSEDSSREGNRVSLGGDISRPLVANVVLQAGVTASEQDAREEDQQYTSYQGYVGVFAPTWERGSVYARVVYTETDYEGRVILFNEGRKEEEQRYVVGLLHNLGDGWQAGASYSYTDNTANVEIYEFDRNEVSFDLSKRF